MSFANNAVSELAPLAPEACVAVGICAVLCADLVPALRTRTAGLWLGVLACAIAAVLALSPARAIVAQMLVIDGVAGLVRPVIALVTAFVLIAGAGERRSANDNGAWATCVLGIGLGAMLVAAAANLIVLWLGLELISLASYALASWRARDRRAAEAGMKFVLFGGAASGVMLFGISHVFGLTGHLDFTGIGAAFAQQMPIAVLASLLMAFVGVAYKLTIVPFHFYAPDVYQGAPALSVAAVGAVPKLAAGAVLLRGLATMLPPSLVPPASVGAVLAVAAMVSLGVASLTALAQRDAKRIVAFSGIGHGGTVLLAAASGGGTAAAASAIFYLLAYAAANVGALLCLSVLERDLGSCELAKLAGAIRRRPWVTVLLCLFLFSLAGVPPLAGFTAKWAVLQQALGGGPMLVAAAFALLASTAIFAWSYLLIIRAAVLAPAPLLPRASGVRMPLPTAFVLLCCAAGTIGLGLWLDALPAIAQVFS